MTPDASPQYEVNAQAVAGEAAAIACSARRTSPGPNGEWHQAFVVWSGDAGVTWSCLPLVRTVWSCFRFWGFPVWPPEYIDAVAIERGLIRVDFRDEWVPFEPGGESQWTGRRSARGLWTVKRVRLMDYDGADLPRSPPPIAIDLPRGFQPPPGQLLDHLASRLAADTRARLPERLAWPLAISLGMTAAVLGEGWLLVSIIVASLVALPVASIWVERRRHRRTVSFP
jgi:hypothetical protein